MNADLPHFLVQRVQRVDELVGVSRATRWALVRAWLHGWSSCRRFQASLEVVFA